MQIRKLLFGLSLFFIPTFLYAQNVEKVDSFAAALTDIKSKINNKNATKSTPYVSPYYYRLIEPGVYYPSATKGVLKLDEDFDVKDNRDWLNQEIDNMLLNIYLTDPSRIRYSGETIKEEQLVDAEKVIESPLPTTKVDDILNDELKETAAKDIDTSIDDIGMEVVKPNFWKCQGQFSLQFSQNYFSDNWYKGGNNNQNLLSAIILEANYDDNRKLTWENKLEMRLGFITTTSDTCHTFLTSNDKIRLFSKLGIKAKKSWYYTASAEAVSQFLPGYKTNDRRKYSSFLSPLDVYVSLGMDFKPSLKNGNTFSLALLPLTYKMRMLRDKDENIHRVYNMVDEDITHDFGSKLDLNCKLKIAKDFFWKSRLYYFTAYDYTEAEWENSFTYAFSKYINAEVYTLWRFDDNRDRKYYDDTLGYFQFKEYFTLGLTYSF